ncbi:MAG: glycosyltransferase [Chloroflexi bacterium]|nr:glycosyltransferase [Chloroflexota bacterium]
MPIDFQKIKKRFSSGISAKSNGLKLTKELSAEWKLPPESPIETSIATIDGVKVVRFVTQAGMGWVRLHLEVPAQPAPVLGIRFLIRITTSDKTTSVKPFVVASKLGTRQRNEIPTAPSTRIKIDSGQWYDVSGAVINNTMEDGYRLDAVMDIPQDAEIEIADVSYGSFPAELSKQVVASLAKADYNTTLLAKFRPTPVHDLKEWIKAPAIYASNISLEKTKLTGYALTQAKKLSWITTDTGKATALHLSGAPTVDGVSIANSGVSVQFDTPLAEHVSIALTAGPQTRQPFWSGALSSVGMGKDAVRSKWQRPYQNNIVLLWGPISTSGLTVQLEQVTKILKQLKLDFQISYHMRPNIDHPLCKHWVEPRDIDQPKLAIFFERFAEFDRGLDAAYKVFYLNLDWLAPRTHTLAKMHANLVLCPTPFKLETFEQEFQNSKVVHLPWPSKFAPRYADEATKQLGPIRILYVGNDYDQESRKHPHAVVEAIEKLERDDVVFDLKFRSRLPENVRNTLIRNPRVGKIVDWATSHTVVEELYAQADINLIPNACEGNGLSILEAWSSGTVPAVLDGHPMKDVTRLDNSYRIACHEVGHKEQAPLYETTSAQILEFLNGLTSEDVAARKATVRRMEQDLLDRETALEDVIRNSARISGMRTKQVRLDLENAHRSNPDFPDMPPRSGQRVQALLFEDQAHKAYRKAPQLIDVLMTTSQRPWCLRESLGQMLEAIHKSPFEHRLLLSVDSMDPETLEILNEHKDRIDHVTWARERHGLPYHWNSLNDLRRNMAYRMERKPDYVCYIQDDCYIIDPETYFEKMVGIAHDAMPGYLGYVSGYYTEVHPGFADLDWNGNPVIASDTIDGKNFMATPEVLDSVGPLTWWFDDGSRRGNPGPVRGSHFDLWQWKESPNSLTKQSRISLVLPELCSHLADTAEGSTWNNDTSADAVKKRMTEGRVYKTRS